MEFLSADTFTGSLAKLTGEEMTLIGHTHEQYARPPTTR